MAFEAFNTTETEAGKPTKQELFRRVLSNFDDHEARIGALESSEGSFRPLGFLVNGYYRNGGDYQTEVLIDRINFDLTLTGARLLIKKAGTSGTLEVDVLYRRGGVWASIFATRPSVDYSAGDYALSTNAVLAVSDLLSGDVLRLDITSPQIEGNGFLLALDYEPK